MSCIIIISSLSHTYLSVRRGDGKDVVVHPPFGNPIKNMAESATFLAAGAS
jgi:hypothetical protein